MNVTNGNARNPLETTAEIAGRTKSLPAHLVDLVLGTETEWEDWDQWEPTFLGYVLDNAGFEVTSLTRKFVTIPGKGTGDITINRASGWKVEEKSNNWDSATSWLNAIYREIRNQRPLAESLEAIIEWVSEQIVRSRPLEPIQLTEDGELFLEREPSGIELVEHTRPTSKLYRGSQIGRHKGCKTYGGEIHIGDKLVAPNTEVIFCKNCNLRVKAHVERPMETYGDLIDWSQREFGHTDV